MRIGGQGMKRKAVMVLNTLTCVLVSCSTVGFADSEVRNTSIQSSFESDVSSDELATTPSSETSTEGSITTSSSEISTEDSVETSSIGDPVDKEKNNEEGPDSSSETEYSMQEKVVLQDNQELNVRAAADNWEATDKGSYYLLTKYTGNETSIVVPTELNGKPTRLSNINKDVFPNYASIKSFSVLQVNGQKVPITQWWLANCFSDWNSLETVDLTGLDVSSVTDMNSMFKDCRASTLNLSGWDTSNVRDMGSMFTGVKRIKSLDLSSFDTSKVTNMSHMFSWSTISQLDISSFNTQSVTNMWSMFAGMYYLKNIDLSHFNTSNVTNMQQMFHMCIGLESLSLTSFDTSKVTTMINMFYGTSNLKILNLSSFTTTSLDKTKSQVMFSITSPETFVVIANDSYFFNYPYTKENRLTPQILFNANGGSYTGGETQLNYFSSCAIQPDNLKLSALEKFRTDNIPTKSGFVFDGYSPATDTSANSVLDLIGTSYDAQWRNPTITFRVPDTISFGTHTISKGTQYYPVEDLQGSSLEVTDERGRGNKWQLTAKLQSPMTNALGKTLPNSLIYRTSTEDKVITDSASQVIQTRTTDTDIETIDISNTWNSSQGLILKINEGEAYVGSYKGQIEWSLNDVPTN